MHFIFIVATLICVCVIGDCFLTFSFVLFVWLSLSRMILSQFKNICLHKKRECIPWCARRHWRGIRNIQNKRTQTKQQKKRTLIEKRIAAKINGLKLNIYIFIRSNTTKIMTLSTKCDLHFGYIWWFFGHRIASGSHVCVCMDHSSWKITLFHRVQAQQHTILIY